MTGQKHGFLTVLEFVGIDEWGSALWRCKCDCGNTCEVRRPYLTGQRGCRFQSCGCKKWEGNKRPERRHDSRTYASWLAMRERCNSPNAVGYANYGGRGIKVCPEWDDFEQFRRDMGERPEGMTIDRVDNNGNYEKGNCRWATPLEQMRNRRSNKMVTINGATKHVQGWDRHFGFRLGATADRLKNGWPPERLGEPIHEKRKTPKP